MKPLQKLKDSHGGRRMLLGLLMVILVAGALGVLCLVAQTDREMREDQIAQTRLVAAAVNLERFKALTGTETDLESPDYLRLKEQLALIRAANAQCRFVYLMGRKADGSVFFYMDSEPSDSKDYSLPGQIYEESLESFRRIFDTGAPLVEGPYSDQWGTWVSSLVPLTDPQSGTVLTVIGMDIDARDWQMNVASQAALPVGLVLLLMIGLLTVLFAAMRVSSSPKPVLRRLLPFMVILIMALVISTVALIWQQQSERITENTVMMRDEVTQDLKQTLEQQARGLTATAQSIALDPRVREAMSAEDTDRLLTDWKGLFETLHREQSLTSFTFIDVNHVALLLFHKPEMQGDKIELFTLLEAERTGKPAWGIELSPLGTFTLRAVQPVFDGQRLVGYIGLGKEIEDVWQSLNENKEFQIAFSIKKDMLQREAWESGMRMLGRDADWERLPHSVIIYASQGRLPDDFAQLLDHDPLADHYGTTDGDIADSGRDWRVTVSPLTDASGKDVGDLLIMVDITDMNAALVRNITLEVIAGAVILAVLLGLTFVMLRRTDAGIRAEQAKLAESEIRFDQLAVHSRTITWETNADGLYTFVSHVVKKVLGYDEEELVGKLHFYDLHSEEEIEEFKQAAFEVFARKEPFVDLVNTARCKTGETRWVSTNGIPLLDLDGTLRGYRGSDTDITEQYLTNTKLAESETKFRQLVENTNDIIYSLTPEGIFTFVSPAWTRLLGHIAEEVEGHLFTEFVHPDDLPSCYAFLQKVVETGVRQEGVEYRVRHKDGEWCWHTSSANPKKDTKGAVIGYDGLARDITQRKAAEDALRASDANFRAFFASMQDMVVVGTPEGRVLYANDAILQKLGYTVEELDALGILGIHPQDRRLEAEEIFAAMFRGERDSCPLPVQRKNGLLLPVETRISFGKWDGRDCVFGISKDLTAEQEAQQRFERMFHNNPSLMGLSVLPERRFVDVNDAWLKVLGYDRAEVLGKTAAELDLFPNTDQQKAVLDILAAGGRVVNVEMKVRCKDGTLRDGLFSGEAIASQEYQYFLTVMIDITERKRDEEALRESGDRFKSIISVSNTGAWEFQGDTSYLWCSPEYFAMLGRDPGDFTMDGRANIKDVWLDLLHPDDVERAEQAFAEYLKNGSVGMYESQFRMHHTDGSWVWIWSRGNTLRNLDGSPTDKTVGTHINVTERIQAEAKLRNREEYLSATLRSIGDGVIACDVAGSVVNINIAAEALTGWTFAEAVGKHVGEVFRIVNVQTRETADNPVFRAIREGVSVDLANHTALIAKDGTERQIADSCAPIRDITGAVTGAVLVFRDVTEQYRKREEIKHLSFHDHLTELFNRRFYEAELTRLDTERNWPLTIVMGDVNGLKLVNDTFGHNAGDQLLIKAAATIKNSCRADEIVARIGGDEFAILLPKTDAFEAEKLIKRIRGLCEKERIEGVELSVSFGYGTKISETDEIEVIITKAEDMMYHNKLFEGSSIRRNLIDSIFNALNSKSEREKKHSRRVSELCKRMGIALNMEDYNIKELGALGLLHDIGKIAISDTTLNKPGRLTENEWIEMKSHSEIGYRILRTNNDTAKIAEYVLAHHERWDGKGYPKGLKGERIPLPSRICAIADSYDAMISNRIYKSALTKDAALTELRNNAGTQFDPELVIIFVDKVLCKK